MYGEGGVDGEMDASGKVQVEAVCCCRGLQRVQECLELGGVGREKEGVVSVEEFGALCAQEVGPWASGESLVCELQDPVQENYEEVGGERAALSDASVLGKSL